MHALSKACWDSLSAKRCRRPCANCPWRKDAPAQYWDPGHFRSIYRNCQDDGTNRMLCHKAKADAPSLKQPTCQGWVRVMGDRAIGVRIALARGLVTPAETMDTKGLDLFESFEAMLRANNVEPPPRNVYDFEADKARVLEHRRKR